MEISKKREQEKELVSLMIRIYCRKKHGGKPLCKECATKDICQFNILKCPYVKYCAELGCPELAHIFCNNDIYAYGSLEGIQFLRTQTLGTGGEKCDFLLKRSR